MILARRQFLHGLGSLLAAPAIVRFDSIMPVRVMLPTYTFDSFDRFLPNIDVDYQWISDELMPQMMSWDPVPASRYNDTFDISGEKIVHGGMTLMQRTRKAAVESRAKEIEEAHNLVSNWKRKYGGCVSDTPAIDYFTTRPIPELKT